MSPRESEILEAARRMSMIPEEMGLTDDEAEILFGTIVAAWTAQMARRNPRFLLKTFEAAIQDNGLRIVESPTAEGGN